MIGRHTVLDDVGVASDDGEQVVEVVRDSASQLPDRLHFLGLAKLVVPALLVCDVLDDYLEGVLTVVRLDDLAVEAHRDRLAIGTDPIDLTLLDHAGLDGPFHALGAPAGGGVDRFRTGLDQCLRGLVAKHRDQGRVDLQEATVLRRYQQAEDRVLEDRLVAVAGGSLGRLGAIPALQRLVELLDDGLDLRRGPAGQRNRPALCRHRDATRKLSERGSDSPVPAGGDQRARQQDQERNLHLSSLRSPCRCQHEFRRDAGVDQPAVVELDRAPCAFTVRCGEPEFLAEEIEVDEFRDPLPGCEEPVGIRRRGQLPSHPLLGESGARDDDPFGGRDRHNDGSIRTIDAQQLAQLHQRDGTHHRAGESLLRIQNGRHKRKNPGVSDRIEDGAPDDEPRIVCHGGDRRPAERRGPRRDRPGGARQVPIPVHRYEVGQEGKEVGEGPQHLVAHHALDQRLAKPRRRGRQGFLGLDEELTDGHRGRISVNEGLGPCCLLRPL